MKKIAFYGGSFDPVHRGHLAIAKAVLEDFGLDEFIFIPASHAPHKLRKKPTSAYDRYTMLCLATNDLSTIRVSRVEIDTPDRPYSVETLTHLTEKLPDAEIYFVMGADSWMDITTWREWEKVLGLTNHIVVTRPGVEIGFSHVTERVRQRIIDLRQNGNAREQIAGARHSIYITDSVNYAISATDIRHRIKDDDESWRRDVPGEVANYIEKYQIYK